MKYQDIVKAFDAIMYRTTLDNADNDKIKLRPIYYKDYKINPNFHAERREYIYKLLHNKRIYELSSLSDPLRYLGIFKDVITDYNKPNGYSYDDYNDDLVNDKMQIEHKNVIKQYELNNYKIEYYYEDCPKNFDETLFIENRLLPTGTDEDNGDENILHADPDIDEDNVVETMPAEQANGGKKTRRKSRKTKKSKNQKKQNKKRRTLRYLPSRPVSQ